MVLFEINILFLRKIKTLPKHIPCLLLITACIKVWIKVKPTSSCLPDSWLSWHVLGSRCCQMLSQTLVIKKREEYLFLENRYIKVNKQIQEYLRSKGLYFINPFIPSFWEPRGSASFNFSVAHILFLKNRQISIPDNTKYKLSEQCGGLQKKCTSTKLGLAKASSACWLHLS